MSPQPIRTEDRLDPRDVASPRRPRDTHGVIPEESTTPGLVERTRQAFEAAGRNDVDALIGFYAADAVLDLSDLGVGTFEGGAALRTFLEAGGARGGGPPDRGGGDCRSRRRCGVSRVREVGRLVGSRRHVEQRMGWVFRWAQGMIERLTVYSDIDEARAAAERLAGSRG
jgi:hypothetical protein